MNRLLFYLLYRFLISFFPILLFASPNVFISDDVYFYLNKLESYGLIHTTVKSFPQLTRKEIARQILEAQKNKIKLTDSEELFAVEKILNTLKKDFAYEIQDTRYEKLHYKPIARARIDFDFLKAKKHLIVQNNGVGSIDAKVQSFTENQEGRNFEDGLNTHVETNHYAELFNHASVYFEPIYYLTFSDDTSDTSRIEIHKLYAKTYFYNIELEVGRDSIVWGNSYKNYALLGPNAFPFDLIKLSFPHPIILPYLGPFKFELFHARLSFNTFRHPYLTGSQFGFRPASFFEFSASQALMWGGDGATEFGFWEGFKEWFFKRTDLHNRDISNRIVSFNFRFYLEHLNNTQIYLDTALEDKRFLHSLENQLVDMDTYILGFYFPRLTNTPEYDLRLELMRTPPIAYRHASYTGGWTDRSNLLANALGPDGDSIDVTFNYHYQMKHTFTFNGGFESRESDIYTTIYDPQSPQDGYDEVLIEERIHESKLIGQIGYKTSLSENLVATMKLGYAKVFNFNYVRDDNKNNVLFNLGIEYTF